MAVGVDEREGVPMMEAGKDFYLLCRVNGVTNGRTRNSSASGDSPFLLFRPPALLVYLFTGKIYRSIFHHALALSLSAGDALHAARYGSYFNSVSLALVQWGLNL